MSEKKNHLQFFIKPIWIENPLFVLLLGTCPALATTKTIESAIGMGILFMLVLIGSNVVISLLKKLIPEEVKIPCYIVIIATFVTLVKMVAEAYLADLYSTLGVFISLIVVNCIVLGRAEVFASKNSVFDSFLDGIGNGIGYTIAIVIIAAIREILGTGGITIGKTLPLPYFQWLPLKSFAIKILTTPAGAFLVLGLVLGIIAAIQLRKSTKKTVLARIEKQKAAAAAAQQAQAAQEEAK